MDIEVSQASRCEALLLIYMQISFWHRSRVSEASKNELLADPTISIDKRGRLAGTCMEY